jgi:hypothetical protein
MRKKIILARHTPIIIIILLLVVLLLGLFQYFSPGISVVYNVPTERVLNVWFNGLTSSNPWFVFGALPIIFLNLILLYQINEQFGIVQDANYLPLWIYVLISITDYRMFHISAELIASSFLIISVFFIFKTTKTRNKYGEIFWSGFMITAGGLFHPQVLVFVPVVFMALVILKKVQFKEFANFCLGIITILFLLFSWAYLTDNMLIFRQQFLFEQLFQGFVFPGFVILLEDILLLLLVVASLICLFANISFQKVQTRKFLYVLVLILLFALGFYMVDGCNQYLRFYFAFPLSILVSYFMKKTKKRLLAKTLISIVIIVFSIFQILALVSSTYVM